MPLGKYESPYTPAMDLIELLLFFKEAGFGIEYPRNIIMPLNKVILARLFASRITLMSFKEIWIQLLSFQLRVKLQDTLDFFNSGCQPA